MTHDTTETVDGEVVEELTKTVAALAVREHDDALVRPAADVAQVERAFKDYQELTTRLLTDDDYQPIRQWNPRTRKEETKKFPKRSAWRKLGVAFGVTFEIISRDKERDSAGRIVSADFVVRATAPNGRFTDGWGNCDRYERCCLRDCRKRHTHCPTDCDGLRHFTHAEHDIPATAETRAKNRAAADLFGMGQVSAEEISGEVATPPPPATDTSLGASDGGKPTAPQKKKAYALIGKLVKAEAFTDEQAKEALAAQYGTEKVEELTKTQISDLIQRLEAKEKELGLE